MIRQYIGARYTPKFMGLFDPTTEYENLCVVDNGAGTTYISSKPVPPNTPLTNREYWQVYGASSGAILDLQKRVTDIEEVDLPTIDSNITAINSSILAIGGQINNIEDDISKINNKKYLFLGDSYYLGSTSISMSNQGWADFVIQYMGLNPNEYIKANLDDICGIPNQIATPGFYPSAGVHRSFRTILESVYIRIGAEVASTITDIVVCGGYNDINRDGVTDGISAYASYAKSHFPNAKLWVGCIAYNGGNNGATARDAIINTVRPQYQTSILYGMTYISDAEMILPSKAFFESASPAHPNVSGYRRIGQAIANALQGGHGIYPKVESDEISITDSVWSYNSSNHLMVNSNKYGEKKISGTGVLLAANDTVTIPPMGRLEIKIDCDLILVSSLNSTLCMCALGAPSGYLKSQIPASILFSYNSNNDLMMYIYFSNSESLSITGINFLLLESEHSSNII